MASIRTPAKDKDGNGRQRLAPAEGGTPTRNGNRSTTPSGSTTTTTTTPAKLRSRVKSPVSASPQVRAALAAMRKQRPPPPPAPDFFSPDADPNNVSASSVFGIGGSLRTDSGGSSSSVSQQEQQQEDEIGAEWGMKSIPALIEGARKTGRLNIASRSLTCIPPLALNTLVPITSDFHPSKRSKPTFKATPVDLTIAKCDDASAWYEQVDLKVLNLANNEIAELEEEVAGFEDLEHLDLHNNYFPSLPPSLSLLVHLTILNLSSNKLTSFPIPLLSLSNLRELNLSSNAMEGLWEEDWRDQVGIGGKDWSPSNTPQSEKSAGGFWEGFSPTKSRHPTLTTPTTPTTMAQNGPFPKLHSLNLSDNQFEKDTFTKTAFQLPPNLVELDLSSNGLFDSHLPIFVFGTLDKLSRLNLSDNEIGDEFFSFPLDGLGDGEGESLFPKLTTLNLERNGIDSFESAQKTFDRIKRKLSFVGMPRIVMNVLRAEEMRAQGEGRGEIGERIEVRLDGNMMRDEPGWRRKRFDCVRGRKEEAVEEVTKKLEGVSVVEPPPPAYEAVTLDVPSSPKPKDVDDESDPTTPTIPAPPTPTLSSPSTIPATAPPTPTLSSTPDPTPEASSDDPAVGLVSSAFNRSRATLQLVRQSLTTLPVPTTGHPPPSLHPTSIDLSHNLFVALPLEPIVEWGWSRLRHLDLSGNRLVGIEGGGVLEELRDLDLSNNWLESTVDGSPLFERVAKFAPRLMELDLSANRMTSMEGVEKVLIPRLGDGLVGLRLQENMIGDIEDLCEVAKVMESDRGGLGKGWRCLTLDLTDNNVGRLSPVLGLLPHDLNLMVLGNSFRIPRRDVLESLGSRGLLEWLKDRC